MKTLKMRYYYMAPLIVLAMVACAKRDNDFAKKAAAAKAAQEKANDPSNPNANKGTGSDTDKGAGTGTGAGRDGKPSDNVSNKPGVYNGDLTKKMGVLADTCDKSAISMEPNSEKGEEELIVKELISNEKGTYILQSVDVFAERTEKGSTKKSQVAYHGDFLEKPSDLKDRFDSNKISISCLTVDTSDQSTQSLVVDQAQLPYDIYTEDGTITTVRVERLELGKSTHKPYSSLFAQKKNIKDIISADNAGFKSLFVKIKDSTDIKITFQFVKDGVTTTIAGTYSLKK